MIRRMRWVLAAAFTLVIAAAFETPANGEETVDAEQKISLLRQASRELSELARQPLPAGLSPEEKSEADAYTRWLLEASAQFANFANSWQRALEKVLADAKTADAMLATQEMHEMNMSFNLQYLQLQQKMQSENRQFAMVSNIMKTKHDTAKNAINNVR